MSALDAAVRLAEAVHEEQRLTHVIRSSECPFSHMAVFLTKWADERRESDLHNEREFAPEVEVEWAAMRKCPVCWAAYEAVQDRKVVRRRRGNARAALARIGASEIKRRAKEGARNE